jgi:putative ABC transport system permease protein
MKLWRFVRKNVFRNKRRTLPTVASLGVSIFIVNTLASVLRGFQHTDPGAGGHLRLLTRHKVSLTNPLPESYWEKLKSVPHIVAITPWSWFGGVYKDETQNNWFARFSADPDGYLAVVGPERPLPQDQFRAWKEDRRGAIAGASLAQRLGWKIGDLISIKGDIYPVTIDVVLRGIFTAKKVDDENNLLFQHMYIEELTGRKGVVGTYWMRIDSPENSTAVAKTIDKMTENSDAETLTETENQFLADFVSMMGNVKGLISAIGLCVGVVILMLAANTMAMAVRERTTEVAVMKAIGFTPGKILGLIVGESLAIGLLSLALACGMGFLLYNVMDFRLPGLWTPMVLTPMTVLIAATIAIGISLISGLIPGLSAARMGVVEGLRKVA